jgi:hypothetical protein
MEYLQFIFQDFWHWLGAIFIIAVVGDRIVGIFRAIFRTKIKEQKEIIETKGDIK